MLDEPKLKSLHDLVEDLTKEELIWMNGYVSGLAKNPVGQKHKSLAGKVTIAFGTETGNSKKLATEFATKARKLGFSVKLLGLDQYRLTDLSKEEIFLTVISTHGEGEPPASAKKFYDYIHSKPLGLQQLRYSVLALGDTAYPLFCKAGEDVDATLKMLGARQLIPMCKCDTDYEYSSHQWFDQVVETLTTEVPVRSEKKLAPPSIQKKYFKGTILSKVNLNGKGSSKETFHIELEASDLVYEAGDSIGILPENPLATVQAIIHATGLDDSKKITFKEQEWTIGEWLTKKVNIFYLPERLVSKYAAIVNQQIPATRIDLLDLVKIYPPQRKEQFEEVIHLLEPITPRLYSISSSLLAHSGEVHITVARNCFQLDGEIRYGLCSDYLAALPENASVDFYIHKNRQFKLAASDKDIIMIGPGTGIAPFRAFIEERANNGATGKSWLFFGEQHFTTDFLYQTELQDYFKTGVLSKINVAFSRDQKQKVYVQHKIKKQAVDFYRWVEGGAYVYVCGTKDPMSEDVEKTLLEIIQSEGDKTEEQAQAFLNQMVEQGRYLKDVY
ncbi:MAG: flavodoxin domain-containing protein [Cyclobacteriaceae bacterium]|nr:flavodoxin domain-containing protein [Cyclobacteriaceae bacterium]